MSEHVILFGGPMGAGKTTAIRSISDIDVVSTEAANSERHLVDKPTTTVALDYGEILVGPDEKVRLYGIPGQSRFDFMWAILKERAEGMVLLVGLDTPDPVQATLEFLDEFDELADRGAVVVGVTRSDLVPDAAASVARIVAAVGRARPHVVLPVFTVDPRSSTQMRTTLMTLVVNIETYAALSRRAATA